MGKSTRPVIKKPADAASIALAKRKPHLKISRLEQKLLRNAQLDSFALYMQLAWQCDEATGIVHGATYDSLRKHLLNDDLLPVTRSNLRICLLDLDDIGLIVFDRSTPTKRSPVLGITVPHQVEPGTA